MSEINMNEILKCQLMIQICLYRHQWGIWGALKLNCHIFLLPLVLLHTCASLGRSMGGSATLYGGDKESTRFGSTEDGPALLSTSASNGQRSFSVFSRLISFSSWAYGDSPPLPWREPIRWLRLVSGMWAKIDRSKPFWSGHAQYSSGGFFQLFPLLPLSALDKDLQSSEATEDTGTIKDNRRNCP